MMLWLCWLTDSSTNNFIFRMVMDDENRCKQLLERLLDISIDVVEIRQPEKSTEFDKNTKGIRLDLYVKDMAGVIYDVEMQTGENKPEYFGKRTRYYQSALDMELLNKGNSYRKLGRTIIIFICTFDPFEKGISKYTFKNICQEDNSVELYDDTVKIFFNAKGNREGLSAELTNFLDYVSGKVVNDDFTRQLDDDVKRVKQDRRKRVDFMTWQQYVIEEREDAREEGLEQGIELNSSATAVRMLKRGKATIQEIAEDCDLSEEKVLELARENNIEIKESA